EEIQKDFNDSQAGNKKVSLADLIVLGGCVAIKKAAKDAGHDIGVPFAPGRMDASEEQTDAEAFEPLQPNADGFRNYFRNRDHIEASAEEFLVDKAQLLNLNPPEMTVLVGGMRVLDTNYDGSKHGVFTNRPGQLTNDFFVNLLDMRTTWKGKTDAQNVFAGNNRASGDPRWNGTRVNKIFRSNSELRALALVYASDDAKEKFVKDF